MSWFFLYKWYFWASPGLGNLTIGFLVKNYIYFDIGIPLKDIMGSIYKENQKSSQKVLEVRFCKRFLVGFGRFLKVFEGFGRFWEVLEGFGRFGKVWKGFERFWDDFGRFY